MKEFLIVFQLVISVLLILVVLSQDKGTGLSATFGGGGGFHRSKRGAEKVLSNITVIIAVLFVLTSFMFVFTD